MYCINNDEWFAIQPMITNFYLYKNILKYQDILRSMILIVLTYYLYNLKYWKIYFTMYNWLIIFMNEILNECNTCILFNVMKNKHNNIMWNADVFKGFLCREYFIWPRWGENFSTTKKLFVASCKTQYFHKCLLSTLLSFEASCFFFEKLCNVIICKFLYFPLAT